MSSSNLSKFQNFSPHLLHIVNRVSTPHWNIPLSKMKCHNIALVYDGEATFIFESVEYKVSKGDIIYSAPGVNRMVHNSKEFPVKLFAVDFLYTCPIFENNEWTMVFPRLPFRTCEHINDKYLFSKIFELLEDLSRSWLSDYSNKLIKCKGLFTDIINTLLVSSSGTSVAYDRVRKVEKVIDHMTYHYNDKISLSDYAKVANISISYLCAIFKEVTGKSPAEYVLHIRINKAKDLLCDGYSVTDVSSAVGFNDIYYFSKAFKKFTGISPSQYNAAVSDS